MKFRITLAAFVLAMAPAAAMAMCSWDSKQTASSCGEGQVWDAQTETCITPLSS